MMKINLMLITFLFFGTTSYADYFEFKTNALFRRGTHLTTPIGKHFSFKLVNQKTNQITELGRYKTANKDAERILLPYGDLEMGSKPIGSEAFGKFKLPDGFVNNVVGEGEIGRTAADTSGQSQYAETQVNHLFLTLIEDSATRSDFGKIIAWSRVEKSPGLEYFAPRSTRIKPNFRCAHGVIHSTRLTTRESLEISIPGIDWSEIAIDAEGNERESKERFHIFFNLVSHDAVLTDRDGTLCYAYDLTAI